MTFVRNHLLSLVIVFVIAGLVRAQYDPLEQNRRDLSLRAQKLKAELRANFDDAAKLEKGNPEKARELLRKNRLLLEDDPNLLSERERNAYLDDVNAKLSKINRDAVARVEAERIEILKNAEKKAFNERETALAYKALKMNNPSPSIPIKQAQDNFKAQMAAQIAMQQQLLKLAQQPPPTQKPGYYVPPVDKSAPPPRDIAIMKALNSTMRVKFDNMKLQDVLDYIDEKAKGALNPIIDEQGFNEVAPDSLAKLLNDPVNLQFKQPMKVRVILKLMLGNRQAGYYIEDGSLYITPEKKVRTKLIVKTYPVSNLVGGDQLVKAAVNELQMTQGKGGPIGQVLGQNIDGLTNQIMGSIDPESWKQAAQPDAPGSMTFVPGSASLQIRATLEVHYLLMASGLLDNNKKN
jgi:hypothetical protein